MDKYNHFRFRFRDPDEPPAIKNRQPKPAPPVQDYLKMNNESYLTYEQARELLLYRGAKEVERTKEGVVRWRAGVRGVVWYGCEPVFISKVGWFYMLSELEQG